MSRFNGSHEVLRAVVKYAAQSNALEFRAMRAGEENSEGSSGMPLSDHEAQQLAEGFDEALTRYL